MAASKNRAGFLTSPEGIDTLNTLREMEESDSYYTESSYSANSALYADNLIPFADKHIQYLMTHPNMDPLQYISNLKLMTRVREPIVKS
ncbi:MAG: hypothetical protein WBP26_02785 [Candidatus Saccharimonadales bacterium]